MDVHETYMHRCIQLARLGEGSVAPNPMVGAVLVHNDRIIGQGYHRKFGEPHAEVDCFDSVRHEDNQLVPQSTMYVCLEPCSHFGKTPPCADLIIKKKVPRVVIGTIDPFPEVRGKGITKLKAAGIEVEIGILQNECTQLNKKFITVHTHHRPYIILKWAQTANGKIANDDYSRVFISNEYTNRLVHKWRSEVASILIGTNTAAFDDPVLTTRLWPGFNPVRMVIDMDMRLPSSLKIFSGEVKTIVFNSLIHEEKANVLFYQITKDVNIVHQIVHALYHLKLQSVMVEGGVKLLQTFIDENMWDEARVITNEELRIDSGLSAPILNEVTLVNKQILSTDKIEIFQPTF